MKAYDRLQTAIFYRHPKCNLVSWRKSCD